MKAGDILGEVPWFERIRDELDTSKTVIQSNVWGWTIECPFGKHAIQILIEGVETLDDACKLCDAWGLKYTILDTQDPDPL